MPLSRQPRLSTSMMSNPEMPAFVTKMLTGPAAKDIRAINMKKLQTSARPTAQFIIEKPLVEGFRVKGVLDNPLEVSGGTNRVGFESDVYLTRDMKRGTHETLDVSGGTNRVGFESDVYLTRDMSRGTHDTLDVSGVTNVSGISADGHMLGEMQNSVHLDANLPAHDAYTNRTRNIEVNGENGLTKLHLESNRPNTNMTVNWGGGGATRSTRGNTTFNRLSEKPSAGAYVPNEGATTNVRGHMIPTLKSKSLRREAFEMARGRR